MKTNYNYELIKDYLDRILDSATSKQIEELITHDETAREIAKGIIQLENHFEDDAQIDNYLDQLLVKNKALIEQKSSTRKFAMFLKIAASVLLIAISGALIYQLSSPTLSELVEAELSQPYIASVTLRDSNTADNLDQAITLYNRGNYSDALELLKNESSAQAIFYHGLSLLYLNEYQRAINELEKAELKSSRYVEQATWFLSIAYLKIGQNDRAEKILEAIASKDNHFKKNAALKLQEALSEN